MAKQKVITHEVRTDLIPIAVLAMEIERLTRVGFEYGFDKGPGPFDISDFVYDNIVELRVAWERQHGVVLVDRAMHEWLDATIKFVLARNAAR